MSCTQVVVLVPDKTRVRQPKAHKVTLIITSVRVRPSLAHPSRLPSITTRTLIAETGVRFSDLRKGSHLLISTQAGRHLPVALKPVAQHPNIAKSISQLPSPLVERREARRKVILAGFIGLERSVAASLARGRPVKSALGIAPPKSGPVSVGRVLVAVAKNVEMKGPSLTDNSLEAVNRLPKKQVSFGDVSVSEVSRWIKPGFIYSPGHDTGSDTPGYRDSKSGLLLPSNCSEDVSGCGLKYSRRLSALNAHINGQCASNGNCSWHWVATHRNYFPDEPPADSFRLMFNIRRNISGV